MERYKAYQTNGEPTVRESAVLFLDLLGTTDPRTDEEAQRGLLDVHSALKRARDWGDSDRADADCVASWFSDNLGMALPVTDATPADEALGTVITNTAAHQTALALHGYPVRGAITYGLFYADEHLLYGPALNRAVALEKARAIYPRVVLDEAAARAAREHLLKVSGGGLGAPHRTQLAVDDEGVTFVNYLGDALVFDEEQTPLNAKYLAEHRDYIVQRLTRFDGEPRIYDKFRWLAAYHDWYVDSVAPHLAKVLDLDARCESDARGPLQPPLRRSARTWRRSTTGSCRSQSDRGLDLGARSGLNLTRNVARAACHRPARRSTWLSAPSSRASCWGALRGARAADIGSVIVGMSSESVQLDLRRLRLRRQEILGCAAEHGARNVRVFGSTARGETGATSDVDLLVEMEPGRSLVDLVGLWQDLEDLLGTHVDVLSEGGVSPFLRERIYADAVAL